MFPIYTSSNKLLRTIILVMLRFVFRRLQSEPVTTLIHALLRDVDKEVHLLLSYGDFIAANDTDRRRQNAYTSRMQKHFKRTTLSVGELYLCSTETTYSVSKHNDDCWTVFQVFKKKYQFVLTGQPQPLIVLRRRKLNRDYSLYKLNKYIGRTKMHYKDVTRLKPMKIQNHIRKLVPA